MVGGATLAEIGDGAVLDSDGSLLLAACAHQPPLRGTGDLGVVVERATGSLQIIETSGRSSLARVEGLGDLSHASVVFSRDERFAYVFGRDGGLTKVDLLEQRIVKRVVQGGNSIGGAISQDGTLIAVGNYEPAGSRYSTPARWSWSPTSRYAAADAVATRGWSACSTRQGGASSTACSTLTRPGCWTSARATRRGSPVSTTSASSPTTVC